MDIKKIITDAHMAGQHNQGVDASLYEAFVYYSEFIKENEPMVHEAELGELLHEAMSLLMNHAEHDDPEWIYDYNKLCNQYNNVDRPMAHEAELGDVAEMLQDFISYSIFRYVDNVICGNNTHRELVDKANKFLWDYNNKKVGNVG